MSLHDLAAQMQELGLVESLGGSAKPSNSIEIPLLKSRHGLTQLAELKRRGARCYPGRAFSPSSLKRLMQSGLKYLDYICEPEQTEADRLEKFYDTRSKNLTQGILFEDLLCLKESGFRKKYTVLDSDKIAAKDKAEAHAAKKRCVRQRDFELVRGMYHNTRRVLPELVRSIQDGAQQVQTKGSYEIGNTEIRLNGFVDVEMRQGSHGVEIKTIDGMHEARQRVFDKPWGTYQYWLQAAVYHAVRDYDRFTFLFVSKKRFHPVLLIKFDRPALDQIVKQFETMCLIPALHYLENGFNTQYFHKDRLKAVECEMKFY